MNRNNKNPMVTLWDAPSNKFTRIPKSELAPGMVQCKIQGRKGLVWREAASIDLEKTPFRHPPFKGNLRLLIGSLSASFAEGRSLPYRKELFRLLVVCNVVPKDAVSIVFEKELLSADEVDAIAKSYYRNFSG